ncbi:MAG: type II toxin-antitoxin system RelE/ParE family toxin [Gammaproteobacteria bacterium]|nr:type II toxin-antitoxin system RelE/ParE family toxin [Gammaproteobacteria bacterium]
MERIPLSIFIYGFAKNEKDNITGKEKEWLKALANVYFSYGQTEIEQAKKAGELIEVVS